MKLRMSDLNYINNNLDFTSKDFMYEYFQLSFTKGNFNVQ